MFIIFAITGIVFLLGFIGYKAAKKKLDAVESGSNLGHSTKLALDHRATTTLDFRETKRLLSKTRYLDNVESIGEASFDMAENGEELFKNVSRILDQKFVPGELTHGRYVNVCMEIQKRFNDQLIGLSQLINSLSISPKDETLREHIKSLQLEIESILAEVRKLTAALIELKSVDSSTQISTDTLMNELKDLSERLSRMNK